MNTGNTENFGDSENAVDDIIMTDIIIYLSKLIESIILRANSKVNYELWMIIKYQCRFILGRKCIILVSVDDNGGGRVYVGVGSIWEISVLSSQLYYEPNSVFLTKILIKRKNDISSS